MVIECIVIIGVFLLMGLVFLRTNHKSWFLAILPLGILPLTNVLLELVVKRLFHAQITVLGEILILVGAVAVEAALLGFCSSIIESKRSKASYISISNAFNVALACILILDLLFRANVLSAITI